MNTEIKTIAVFLPFCSAILQGINYTLNGRIFETVSPPTWMIFCCCSGIVAALGLHFLSPIKIDFAPLFVKPALQMALISAFVSIVSWICYIFAIRNISATYTAIGEVSYPFFTALFTYLIFRAREFDTSMVVGGFLILLSSLIVITDKFKEV